MAIGGYFELELRMGLEFHKHAIRLNTGRNAFEYILRAKNYSKVYLPYYTCNSLLEPILKLKLGYEFYRIDNALKPIFNFSNIKANEVFVYINYFGKCSENVKLITKSCTNLIIDNSQSFFSKPLPAVDTFYSPRKFFGVPDGAYLYTNKELNIEIEKDISIQRFEHLLGRIDIGPEKFLKSFRSNDASFKGQPIKAMSNLTRRILESIDYLDVARKRNENFLFLHAALSSRNQLKFDSDPNSVPMGYPYLVEDGSAIKAKLIDKKIFVATYWPNVLKWTKKDYWEWAISSNLVLLPVDQRYDPAVLIDIIKLLK